MSSTTPNLGLIKPSETDIIDIGNINTNSDKIDISYKNMADQAKQLAEQIKTAQETLTNMNLLIEANKNAITQLNSELDSGQWTPTVLSGGTGIVIDPMSYWRCFNLVFVSCATWKFTVQGPTGENLVLSLPFPVKSIRNFGMMGYNNTGRNIIPACLVNSGLGFVLKNQDGSTIDVKGTDSFGGQVIQFSLVYATGKE